LIFQASETNFRLRNWGYCMMGPRSTVVSILM